MSSKQEKLPPVWQTHSGRPIRLSGYEKGITEWYAIQELISNGPEKDADSTVVREDESKEGGCGTRDERKNEQSDRQRRASCPCRRTSSLTSTPPASPANQAPKAPDVGEKRATLLDLPDHVITQIISLLPVRDVVCGLRQTCRRLHDITLLPYTWKRVEMTFVNNEAVDCAAGRYYSGLLGQRIFSFPVRGLDHDPARREEEDCGGAVLVSGRIKDCEGGAEESAVFNREGSQDGAEKSSVLNSEGCEGGSNTADAETSLVECVETDMRSVVRSLSENYVDLSPRLTPLSIVNGALYPSLQELSLTVDFFPDTAFLSRHTGLRSLSLCSTASLWAPGFPVDNIRKMFHDLRPCTSLEILIIKMNTQQHVESSEQMLRAVAMGPALLGYLASRPVLRRLELDMPVDNVIVRSILEHCLQLQDLLLYSSSLTIEAFENLLETPNTSITSLRLSCLVTDPRLVYAISKSFHGLNNLWLGMVTPADALESSEDLPNWQQAIDTLMLPQAFPKLKVLDVNVSKTTNITKTEFRTDDPIFCLNSQPVKGQLEKVFFTNHTKAISFSFERVCSAHAHLKVLGIEGRTQQFFPDQPEGKQVMTWSTLEEICCSPSCAERKTGQGILRALLDMEDLPCPLILVPSGQPERSVSDQGGDPLNELIAIQWPDNTETRRQDRNLIYLPRPFRHLTSLTILECPTLCDKDVLTILLSCPRLENLWLESSPPTGPPLLTEKTLSNLLDFGTQLRYVMIPHRMKLSSPDSLAKLLTHAPSLASISINIAHLQDVSFMATFLHVWARELICLRAEAKAGRKWRYIGVRTKWLLCGSGELGAILCFSIRRRSDEGEGDLMGYIHEP